MNKLARLTATVAFAGLGLTAGLPASHAAVNLAPNPGFEVAAAAPADPVLVAVAQPVLPDGWTFEGAAGLFDYADQRCLTEPSFPCRRAHSGNRFVAISDPLSGPDCKVDGNCYGAGVRQVGALGYSATPVWRTALPVALNPGQSTYTFSASVQWDLATAGVGGAFLAVRWVDAFGLPISVERVATAVADVNSSNRGDWDPPLGGTAHVPGGAAGAVLMLGHTDDLFISQVRFDDVFFG